MYRHGTSPLGLGLISVVTIHVINTLSFFASTFADNYVAYKKAYSLAIADHTPKGIVLYVSWSFYLNVCDLAGLTCNCSIAIVWFSERLKCRDNMHNYTCTYMHIG